MRRAWCTWERLPIKHWGSACFSTLMIGLYQVSESVTHRGIPEAAQI